jgi:serine/threonine protein kinase
MNQVTPCPQCGAALPADAPQGICPQCLLLEGLHDAAGMQSTTPPGVPDAAPRPEDLAPHFPQLEILELLGQGGMGAVYKARQVKLGRLVALKILPAQASRDPAFAERFQREARALAHLNHPHIVAVHDFGVAGGLFYFLMEFVDGVNLRALIQGRDMTPEQALEIVPQICDALQYAHDEGVVHRDIKPENILLDKKGRAKIADFGLAKLLGAAPGGPRLTASHQIMGTPHYMAPEQVERPQYVDHRADIYALGVVFYEMLTGELPLGKFAPPSHKVRVDVRLDEVVLRTLERDPVRRYQHVSDFKTAVQSLRHVSDTPAVLPQHVETPLWPHQALWLAGMALVLIAVGCGLYWTDSGLALAAIPMLVSLARRLPWQPSVKPLAVLLLVLGSVIVITVGYESLTNFWSTWFWIVFMVWMFDPIAWLFPESEAEKTAQVQATLGVKTTKSVDGKVEPLEGSEEPIDQIIEAVDPDNGSQEQVILRLLKRFDDLVRLHSNIPGDWLREAREACAVPPDDRILGLVDLSGSTCERWENLLFGTRAVYFYTAGNSGAIPYSAFHEQVVVNHGTAIYLGQHGLLALGSWFTTECSVERLSTLLSALQAVLLLRR